MSITQDQLLQIVPAAKNSKLDLDNLCDVINAVFADDSTGLNNGNRQAAFLAQCAYESGYFCHVVENLNYSAEGLLKTFPKYFNSESASDYANLPEKIANRIYANRMGNGPEESGEGFKYRGRGFFQLTGKENYFKCGTSIGVDLENIPEYLETPEGAIKSAIWFWNTRGLSALADNQNITQITKKINGGVLGLTERTQLFQKALEVLT
jgi:putative chitinase